MNSEVLVNLRAAYQLISISLVKVEDEDRDWLEDILAEIAMVIETSTGEDAHAVG